MGPNIFAGCEIEEKLMLKLAHLNDSFSSLLMAYYNVLYLV